MLGNLFNQKKYTESVGESPSAQRPLAQPGTHPVLPQQPQAPQVKQTVAPVQSPSTGTNVLATSLKPQVRQDLSVLTHLDTRTTQVLAQAQQETRRIKQQYIESDQILFGLLYDQDIFSLLQQYSIDVGKLSSQIQANEKEGVYQQQPMLSQASKQLFEKAYTLAKNRDVEFISPEDLLIALLSENSSASALLQKQGIKKEQVEEKLVKTSNYTIGKRSVLDRYGIDLTEEAKQDLLDPVTGRDKEIERLIHILMRRTKNNPVIIGEAGVGKTAIVEGLAQNIVSGSVPKDLLHKRIIQLDVSSLVAGASHRGEFEERLRSVIKEAQASSGQLILFIDEVHNLIGAGDTDGAMDASNIIKPFLARGQLQIIGTTTIGEYRRYFEKDKAFERRFQPILVEEPSEEGAIQMLTVLKAKYEAFHKVVFSQEALENAVHLSKKYIGERFLPDKAVDLLDEAAAEVRLTQAEGKRLDNTVAKSDIEKVVSAATGIPITKLTEDESEKLLHLEDLIHKRLIDQTAAVSAVCEAVRRGRIGLASANRPIASFIFLGPTGVGKTELAKALAELLFGREDAMVRLDMSEYMEKHEVAKLIGAPPGYVGYEEGGQLTEAVRAKPYSIVLLDEIEKAHPDVFNILLQILEDGRLTDNKGNTISFKNTIIIGTSNIGSALIQQFLLEDVAKKQEEEGKQQGEDHTQQNQEENASLVLGGQTQPQQQDTASQQAEEVPQEDIAKKYKELSDTLLVELRKFFKPELLNRFDEVVVFEPLAQKDMFAIAKLRIEGTRKLLKEQGFDLAITDVALTELGNEGYDPVYGARPLRRLIQTAIENPVALLIIGKEFVQGDIILIDYDQEKQQFVFRKETASPTATADQNTTQGEETPPQLPTDQTQQQSEDSASQSTEPAKESVGGEVQPLAESTQQSPVGGGEGMLGQQTEPTQDVPVLPQQGVLQDQHVSDGMLSVAPPQPPPQFQVPPQQNEPAQEVPYQPAQPTSGYTSFSAESAQSNGEASPPSPGVVGVGS